MSKPCADEHVSALHREGEMSKAGTCKHFTGIQNKVCKAGVDYETVKPLPCITTFRKGDCTCDKYEEPSQAEIDEWPAFLDERMEMHRKVGPVIVAIKREHKGKSWKGVVECPCCGGRLHVSHAGYNGHVHGQCETEDCLSWME